MYCDYDDDDERRLHHRRHRLLLPRRRHYQCPLRCHRGALQHRRRLRRYHDAACRHRVLHVKKFDSLRFVYSRDPLCAPQQQRSLPQLLLAAYQHCRQLRCHLHVVLAVSAVVGGAATAGAAADDDAAAAAVRCLHRRRRWRYFCRLSYAVACSKLCRRRRCSPCAWHSAAAVLAHEIDDALPVSMLLLPPQLLMLALALTLTAVVSICH